MSIEIKGKEIERNRAEEALRRSEEQLSNAMEMASLGHWEYDVANELFTFNDHFYRIFRTTAKQVGGYTMSSAEYARRFVHPDDMSVVEEENRKAFETTDPHFNRQLEHRILYGDGTVGYITVRFFIVKDSQNRTVRTYGVNQDITERRRLAEERVTLETQLQQAQKMESIGTLAGGIAHDFNNILSPIMIHSEMAMMDLSSGSPLQQNMKQIYKAGERARDLVMQILTFARRHEKELIPLKVSRILKEVIKLLRSSIPTTIDIQYNINSEQDTVLSDPTQLNQIIMNLCTNAVHAMEENGGTLEVILNNENLDSESADAFAELEPGRYVKLTVTDTGQGIEPQFIDKIFEPYFTTKEVGKGTGMGLALVHGIAKSYGGAVTVQSEVGKGTNFHVYLPLVEDDMGVLETAQVSEQLPTGTERILFVDDEKVAVDTMQSMLEKLGYKVTGRTSSIEALEAFRNNPQGFDLVITDQTMPNMTGKDLAKELMTIRSDIPIILCTGFSEKIDERSAEKMGISAFVMKPIVMGQIANTIREVLDKK
jgi:PAS domain S-box-containing protein